LTHHQSLAPSTPVEKIGNIIKMKTEAEYGQNERKVMSVAAVGITRHMNYRKKIFHPYWVGVILTR